MMLRGQSRAGNGCLGMRKGSVPAQRLAGGLPERKTARRPATRGAVPSMDRRGDLAVEQGD